MKNLFYNTLLVVASIVISLLLGEGLCRLVPSLQAHDFATSREDMKISNNSILLYERKSDAKQGVNEDGFWSAGTPDLQRGKKKGVVRIMVLGDSIIQGYQVVPQKNVTALLQQDLRTKGIPAEVINAGVSGYNTLQEVEQFRVKGISYEPDIVVIGFCFNDAVIHSSELHQFNKEYNEQLKKSDHLALPRSREISGGVFDRMLRHSRLASFLNDVIQKRRTNDDYQDAFMKLAQENQQTYRSVRGNWDRLERLSADNEKSLQEMGLSRKKFLSQNRWNRVAAWTLDKTSSMNDWPRVIYACDLLKRTIGNRKTKVLVMIFPLLTDYHAYPFGKTHAFFDAEFQEMGFEVLDLLPYFQEHDVQEISSGDTIHPNELGHQIAAARLSERIQEMWSSRGSPSK